MSLKEKDILVEAFTDMAPDYEYKVNSELNLFWGWSYDGFVKQLIENTPIFDTDKILDVATGTGVISHHLAKKGLSQNHIHGLDFTFSMLERARDRFANSGFGEKGILVCGSATEMPYYESTFSLVICGLATHHMDVEKFANESHRILTSSGRLSIIDAGGSLKWNNPIIKFLIRCAAFIYYYFKENPSRAWAESAAVSNIRAPEEWNVLLTKIGFRDIEIKTLHTKHVLVPSPILIKAVKN